MNVEVSPQAPSVDRVPVHRRRSWRSFAVVGLCVAVLCVPAAWMILRKVPAVDVQVVVWQALLDEESAVRLQQSLVEVSDRDSEWLLTIAAPTPVPLSGKLPAPPMVAVPTKLYRGSGDQIRAALKNLLEKKSGVFLSQHYQTNTVHSQAPLPVRWEWGFLTQLWRRWFESPPKSWGTLEIASFVNEEINQWLREHGQVARFYSHGIQYSTIDKRGRELRLSLSGESRIESFEDVPAGGVKQLRAGVAMNCQSRLKNGEGLVLISRFPQKMPATVLITVCERVDCEQELNLPSELMSLAQWIDAGPDFVRRGAQRIKEWKASAPAEVIPDPHWTQRLAEGGSVSLILVANKEKYPSLSWDPEGKALPSYLPVLAPSSGVTFRVVRRSPPGAVSVPITRQECEEFAQLQLKEGVIASRAAYSRGAETCFLGVPMRTLPGTKQVVADLVEGSGGWTLLGRTASGQVEGEFSIRDYHFSATLIASKEKVVASPNSEKSEKGRIVTGGEVPKVRALKIDCENGKAEDEELRAVLVTKTGERLCEDFPVGPSPATSEKPGIVMHHLRLSSDQSQADLDHIEIEVRPMKRIRFTGFVTEPGELKTIFHPDARTGK